LFAYGPADATVSPKRHHLLHCLNADWFQLSDTGLLRLSWKRRRSSSSSSSSSSLDVSVQIRVISNTRQSQCSTLFCSVCFRFYRAMLCIRATSHGPVPVSVSVCHKSEFYRNG